VYITKYRSQSILTNLCFYEESNLQHLPLLVVTLKSLRGERRGRAVVMVVFRYKAMVEHITLSTIRRRVRILRRKVADNLTVLKMAAITTTKCPLLDGNPLHREQVALLEGLPHLLPAPMDMLDMDHQDIVSHLGRVHNLGTAHLRIMAAPVIDVEVVVMGMDMDMDMEDLVREYELISSGDRYQPYGDNGAQF
jgi:hypothetical protein